MWYGATGLPRLNHHLGRHWTDRQGPVGGPLETLGVLLHLVSAVERDARTVLDCHRQAMPDLLRLARTLPAAELRAATLPEALGRLWPVLAGRPVSRRGR
jgi:hypothetical protein